MLQMLYDSRCVKTNLSHVVAVVDEEAVVEAVDSVVMVSSSQVRNVISLVVHLGVRTVSSISQPIQEPILSQISG